MAILAAMAITFNHGYSQAAMKLLAYYGYGCYGYYGYYGYYD
jgi:hypothetical protein